MIIDKKDGEELLRALEDSIRFAHIEGRNYSIRIRQALHHNIVNKMFRSNEMRNENRLRTTILEGTDCGLQFAKEVIRGERAI